MSEVSTENLSFHKEIEKKALSTESPGLTQGKEKILETKDDEHFSEEQYNLEDFQSQIDSLFEESEEESSTENTKNNCENNKSSNKTPVIENDDMKSSESLINQMLFHSEVRTLPVEQESKCFDDFQSQNLLKSENSVESLTERSVLDDLDFDSLFGENQDLVDSLFSKNESSEKFNASFENSSQSSENSTDQYSILLSSIALPSQIPSTKRKRIEPHNVDSNPQNKIHISQSKYLHTPSPFVKPSNRDQIHHGQAYTNQVLDNKRARLGENLSNNAYSNYNSFLKNNHRFPPSNNNSNNQLGFKGTGNQYQKNMTKTNSAYEPFNVHSQFAKSPASEKESSPDMVSTSPLLPQKNQLPDLLLPSDIKQVPDINLDSPCESASLSPSSPSGQSLTSCSSSSSLDHLGRFPCDSKNDMSSPSAYTHSTVNNSTIAKIKSQMISAHNLISTYTALKRTTQCISDCLVSTKDQNASLRRENEKLAKQNTIFNKEKLLLKQALNKLHRDTNGMGKNEVLLKEISKLNYEIVRLRKKCKEI